ncbi:MAG: hypothetical protein ACREH6_04320 [Geminicoccaceae bacterium]
MMWSYCLVRTADGLGLHEVSYAEDGRVMGMGAAPATFEGGSRDEIVAALLQALSEVRRQPIIEPQAAPDSTHEG